MDPRVHDHGEPAPSLPGFGPDPFCIILFPQCRDDWS